MLISLVYLGYQLRQTNHGLRVGTQYQTATHITQTLLAIAQDEVLSRIWNTGLSDPDRLTPGEYERFFLLLVAYLHQNEAQYFANRHGFHDAGIWVAKEYELTTWIRLPGIGRVWSEYKPTLSPDFVTYVEGLPDPVV